MTTTDQPDWNPPWDVLESAQLPRSTATSLAKRLAVPVDAAWLGFLRVAFGLVIAWEVWRYFEHGWIERYYQDPILYFTYWPFDFVAPWPGTGMVWHFLALALAGLLVAAGLYYRVAAPALFVLFTYIFLLDKARYLNHFYMVSLVALLLCCLPAHRTMSLDALRRPELARATVPTWTLWLMRFQVGVPYLFGGVAKLNADWLRGEPLRAWLAARSDIPLIGRLFTEEPVVWVMAYGSLLFDLAVVPLLLWRRTRPYAFVLAVVFHLLNARLFSLGIFPWMMILLTTVFFPPDWPKRLWVGLQGPRRRGLIISGAIGLGVGTVADDLSLVHGLVAAVGAAACWLDVIATERERASAAESGSSARRVPILLLAIWVAVQVLVPLRHFAVPGNVHWTEEGHRFAWHMMLRSKQAEASFVVTDPRTGAHWDVDPDDWLTSVQAGKMPGRPDMVLQFAHHLEEAWQDVGHGDVEVRAQTSVSLNGRPEAPLVDPTVDLTLQHRPALPPVPWILPLED